MKQRFPGLSPFVECCGAHARALVLCVLLAPAALAQGTTDIGSDGYAIGVELLEPSELRVNYAILPGGLDRIEPPPKVEAVRAVIGETPLGATEPTAYPMDDQTTAVLFLLDISDPARQRVVDRNAEHIAAMAHAGGAHHRFALATFAETLEIVAGIGADADEIAEAAQGIRAVGQRTELVRLGAEAVTYLSAVDADRKAIVLMSDGEAEDDASVYPATHFAEAARRANVRVYALGYHSSREETFGKMRFIAERSGGALIRADPSFALPAAYLEDPFAWLDAGGQATFDLTPATDAGLGGARTLTLEFELEDGTVETAQIEVVLPASEGELAPGALDERIAEHWLIAASALAAVLVLLGLGIWLIRRSRRHQGEDREPVAYLEFLDGDGTRWPMRTKSIKIGRDSDNDLQLKNDTVSAYHATIHLQRDGTFIVTDLNSLNGVLVNGEEVEIAALQDGAELELGEVRCRFTITGAPTEGLLTGNVPDRTLTKEDG